MLKFIGKVRQFWDETVSEVWTKAVWPTPKELAQSTAVVVVSVTILSCCVFVFDFSMHELEKFIRHLIQ